MAPLPMLYVRLRSELLAAREAREALVSEVLVATAAPLVLVSTAMPGPCKTPPGSAALFAWGVGQLREWLDGCRTLADGEDVLGPYALIAAAVDPYRLKAASLAIEAAIPAARLLDLDVYATTGARIGRAEQGEPARRCLLCAEPASDCIRLNRHSLEHLLDHVGHLLAPFADCPTDGPDSNQDAGGIAGQRPPARAGSHPQAGAGGLLGQRLTR